MRRLMKVDGLAILSYFWLYSLGRFVISFYRVNTPILWGLKEAQVIALVVLISRAAGGLLAYPASTKRQDGDAVEESARVRPRRPRPSRRNRVHDLQAGRVSELHAAGAALTYEYVGRDFGYAPEQGLSY